MLQCNKMVLTFIVHCTYWPYREFASHIESGGAKPTHDRGAAMTATTPTFDEFQKFSKEQLEAFTAASTTLSKGLQDIATELTDYSKKAFAAGTAMFEKLLGARSVEIGGPDSDRIRQAGLRGLCRSGDQGLGALHRVASDALKPVTTAYASIQK